MAITVSVVCTRSTVNALLLGLPVVIRQHLKILAGLQGRYLIQCGLPGLVASHLLAVIILNHGKLSTHALGRGTRSFTY